MKENKTSQIPWLGRIPSDWNEMQLKWVLKSAKNGTTATQVEHPTDFPISRIETISKGEIDFKKVGFLDKNDVSHNYILSKGDILFSHINSLEFVGNCALFNSDKLLIHGMNLLRLQSNEGIRPKYLLYYLKSHLAKSYIQSISKHAINQVSVPISSLKAMRIAFPLISKQDSIVEFLEAITQKIDALIEKKQKLIELLQEYRAAIINQAVTKGLDPNVPMKDSGIEWLGKIPHDWRIKPLKYIAYMKGRIGWQGLKQSEFTNEGPFLITGMNFKDGKMDWEICYHISEERYREAPEIHVQNGDVLMTKDGTIGKLLYIDNLPGRASLNSHLLLIRPLDHSLESKYLYYFLQSIFFKAYIETHKTGTTFYGITQEAMRMFKMLLPPQIQQKEIINFIDNKTDAIDYLIKREMKAVDLLFEYRTSLISETVTGKIDVRNKSKNRKKAKKEY